MVGHSAEGEYRIALSRSATKALEDLPRDTLPRIGAAIDALARNPRPQCVEKLSGRDDQYRIRVGDYRIVYTIEDKLLIVLVLQIGNRRDIYRKGRKR